MRTPSSFFPRPVRVAAWLVPVLWASLAAAQAPPSPPRIEETVEEDSLYFLGPQRERVWTYRFLRADDETEVWVEVEDPFGGRVLMTDFFTVVLGQRTVEFVEGSPRQVVNFGTPRGVLIQLALGVVGLLTVFVAPLLWLRRRLRRERERREALQETAHQLAVSREEERKRLARDLHDGPLQELHALHMQLGVAADALTGVLGAEHARELGRLRGAQDEAHTVIGELRGIAEALRPPALGPFGLAAALRAHAERFGRQHPTIRVALALDDDGQALPEPVRVALFRIAQEAMANAAKHASPERVSVALRLADDRATLTVEDDGAGFEGDPADPALAAGGHFGLLGMRERASALGADLRVGRGSLGGVRVEVDAPYGGPREGARSTQ